MAEPISRSQPKSRRPELERAPRSRPARKLVVRHVQDEEAASAREALRRLDDLRLLRVRLGLLLEQRFRAHGVRAEGARGREGDFADGRAGASHGHGVGRHDGGVVRRLGVERREGGHLERSGS